MDETLTQVGVSYKPIKLNIMKKFLKSAFMLDLIVIAIFFVMAFISYLANSVNINGTAPTGFFVVCGVVFLIILPKCSTKN